MSSERLHINEIFYSIQGESTHAGRPCVFVRLTGCNLRCKWCDTEYAFYEGRQMPIAEVAEIIRGYRCDLVEVTGGEPLLQEGVYPLADAMLESGRTVMIETSGAVDVSRLDPRVIKIMDLKCPGSGECDRNLWSNLDHLTRRDEIKFVIADRADYEWARDAIAARDLARRVGALLLSPVSGQLAPAALAAWILEDRLPARLQLQMHKQIWPGISRGV
ncbi:MAG: radical SAM protein [Candidatus Binatus sp.]|jgi:7-carboxy-7-deazaguanine synthase|uniref:radical SAM protein n=1 Tax=Candidatus Binatus sp. TaxID=2811406 RepID=UPI003D14B371